MDGPEQRELLRRWQADGDTQAREALFGELHRVLFAVARKSVGDRDLAEDFVQSTLAVFANQLKDFTHDGLASPSTWCVRILFNKILDWRRKQERRQTHNESIRKYQERLAQQPEKNISDDSSSRDLAEKLIHILPDDDDCPLRRVWCWRNGLDIVDGRLVSIEQVKRPKLAEWFKVGEGTIFNWEQQAKQILQLWWDK